VGTVVGVDGSGEFDEAGLKEPGVDVQLTQLAV
jgi:hypothetical protein